MTDREKLIELLVNDDSPLLYVLGENMGVLADYLIAHGIMVHPWIPVTERLPEEHVDVLVARIDHAGDPVVDIDCIFGDGRFLNSNVTHWMPLPQGPEGLPC